MTQATPPDIERIHWPCGHPRTEQNTQSVGKAGIRCRECRRAINLRHWHRKYGRDRAHLQERQP